MKKYIITNSDSFYCVGFPSSKRISQALLPNTDKYTELPFY